MSQVILALRLCHTAIAYILTGPTRPMRQESIRATKSPSPTDSTYADDSSISLELSFKNIKTKGRTNHTLLALRANGNRLCVAITWVVVASRFQIGHPCL